MTELEIIKMRIGEEFIWSFGKDDTAFTASEIADMFETTVEEICEVCNKKITPQGPMIFYSSDSVQHAYQNIKEKYSNVISKFDDLKRTKGIRVLELQKDEFVYCTGENSQYLTRITLAEMLGIKEMQLYRTLVLNDATTTKKYISFKSKEKAQNALDMVLMSVELNNKKEEEEDLIHIIPYKDGFTFVTEDTVITYDLLIDLLGAYGVSEKIYSCGGYITVGDSIMFRTKTDAQNALDLLLGQKTTSHMQQPKTNPSDNENKLNKQEITNKSSHSIEISFGLGLYIFTKNNEMIDIPKLALALQTPQDAIQKTLIVNGAKIQSNGMISFSTNEAAQNALHCLLALKKIEKSEPEIKSSFSSKPNERLSVDESIEVIHYHEGFTFGKHGSCLTVYNFEEMYNIHYEVIYQFLEEIDNCWEVDEGVFLFRTKELAYEVLPQIVNLKNKIMIRETAPNKYIFFKGDILVSMKDILDDFSITENQFREIVLKDQRGYVADNKNYFFHSEEEAKMAAEDFLAANIESEEEDQETDQVTFIFDIKKSTIHDLFNSFSYRNPNIHFSFENEISDGEEIQTTELGDTKKAILEEFMFIFLTRYYFRNNPIGMNRSDLKMSITGNKNMYQMKYTQTIK